MQDETTFGIGNFRRIRARTLDKSMDGSRECWLAGESDVGENATVSRSGCAFDAVIQRRTSNRVIFRVEKKSGSFETNDSSRRLRLHCYIVPFSAQLFTGHVYCTYVSQILRFLRHTLLFSPSQVPSSRRSIGQQRSELNLRI